MQEKSDFLFIGHADNIKFFRNGVNDFRILVNFFRNLDNLFRKAILTNSTFGGKGVESEFSRSSLGRRSVK